MDLCPTCSDVILVPVTTTYEIEAAAGFRALQLQTVGRLQSRLLLSFLSLFNLFSDILSCVFANNLMKVICSTYQNVHSQQTTRQT